MTQFYYLLNIIVLTFLLMSKPVTIKAENPDTAIVKLKTHKNLILSAAEKFEINWKNLSAIIYVERTKNYDWSDDALDGLFAVSGLNSSIGFCQVKLKTAYWIELQLNDSTTKHYPGRKYEGLLHVSSSPAELLQKLQVDSLNILYAAAYVCIMQKRWRKAGFSIDEKPDILGTLYSTGLFYRDGKERIPNSAPKANNFGKETLAAFNKLKI
ncbi:MAG: hypothetical protein KJ799_08585 [Bacteroidetes bacterium]|nr:hypothetical protein [Bacteroidota bacterium]MBU2506766.1 hypothetical protein [Bacteroidota bacterium]